LPDQEQDNVGRSYHREGDAVVFDRPAEQGEAARQRRENEQHEFARSQVKTNRLLAFFTGALMVATFCTIGVGIWQAVISQEAANAARNAVGVASQTLAETQRSNAVQEQRSHDSLQATISSLEQDQRAWVGPVGALPPQFTENGQHVYIKVGEKLAFGFELSNTGKTPARNLTSIMSAHAYRAGERFVPDYKFYSGRPKEPGTVGVLFPGVRMDVLSDVNGPSANKPDTDLLLKGERIFYIYGKVTYTDVFGKSHQTTFCNYVRKDLTALISCETYNNAD
jgi:hypothetical protein